MTEHEFDEAQQEQPHSAFTSLWYGTIYGSAFMVICYLVYLAWLNY